MRIRKRSSCASGSGKVPSYSMGFCVASTMNGPGRRCVVPSTVTWRSSMASSSADCVFGRGAVDLVGQHDLGHDRAGAELEVAGLLVVDRDAGDVAGQQVGRELDALEAAADRTARLRASIVLPTPGTSSMSTCPWQSSAMSASRTSVPFPMIIFSTFARTRSATSFGSCIRSSGKRGVRRGLACSTRRSRGRFCDYISLPTVRPTQTRRDAAASTTLTASSHP